MFGTRSTTRKQWCPKRTLDVPTATYLGQPLRRDTTFETDRNRRKNGLRGKTPQRHVTNEPGRGDTTLPDDPVTSRREDRIFSVVSGGRENGVDDSSVGAPLTHVTRDVTPDPSRRRYGDLGNSVFRLLRRGVPGPVHCRDLLLTPLTPLCGRDETTPDSGARRCLHLLQG